MSNANMDYVQKQILNALVSLKKSNQLPVNIHSFLAIAFISMLPEVLGDKVLNRDNVSDTYNQWHNIGLKCLMFLHCQKKITIAEATIIKESGLKTFHSLDFISEVNE